MVEGNMRAFLSGLKDEDLSRVIEFSLGGPTHRIPLGYLLQHGAIHAFRPCSLRCRESGFGSDLRPGSVARQRIPNQLNMQG
jgi:hypothetical protein